jgi:hypothetical protein
MFKHIAMQHDSWRVFATLMSKLDLYNTPLP